MTVAELAYKLEKPFAVVVKVNDQTMKREFDTEEEAAAFQQAILLKLPTAAPEIIRRKEKVRGRDGQKDSIAFRPVLDPKTGQQMIGGNGKPIFKCIPVPPKRGHLFCTNCHEYKVFSTIRTRYDDTYHGCSDCGMSVNDFDIKTANGLWERMK
jgi:hypothetical protein